MATDWTSLLAGGMNLAGSLYAGNQAANSAANAAQMASFRPVGVTTRFGSSGFNYGPNGQLTGAGYQVAPDVAAMREGLLGMAGTGLSQVRQQQQAMPTYMQGGQGLFNLGQQYVAQTPQAAAQDWMSKQQQLLAPGREQELAQLTNKEFQRGTYGLSTMATQSGYTPTGPGLAASNPRFAAYYNAKAAQDAQLAAQAQQAGLAQAQAGQGLMTGGMDVMRGGYGLQTAAMAPFNQYFQGATGIENQALNALTQGAGLGSSASQAGAQAAQQYMQGQNAQNAALQGAITGLVDPVAKLIGGLI